MKEVLASAAVPTARHGVFTDLGQARAYLSTLGDLFVIKTDGLAAGKGVLVTPSWREAEDAVEAYLSGDAFGEAGRRVVIEEGLAGPELSLLVVCDGWRLVALAPAKDFKRVGTGDRGPNTGGMGAYSPVPIATDTVVSTIMETAVEPTLRELQRRGIDYRGVLYAGLMLTGDGPKIIEYNVRFGDPEAQVVLPRLASSLTQLLAQAAAGEIIDDVRFTDDAAVTVVCATEGYPTSTRLGDRIIGLGEAAAVEGVTIFCAGVDERQGHLCTAGGRVLNVTATGPTLASAQRRAYQAVGQLSWPGMHYRADIAEAADSPAPR